MSGRSLSRFNYSKAKRNKSHHTNKGAAGSNLIKAKTPARQFSCCDLQRTMTALRLHLSHRIRLVRILKADMAWGSITSSVRLPFRSIPQATSRRRNGP